MVNVRLVRCERFSTVDALYVAGRVYSVSDALAEELLAKKDNLGMPYFEVARVSETVDAGADGESGEGSGEGSDEGQDDGPGGSSEDKPKDKQKKQSGGKRGRPRKKAKGEGEIDPKNEPTPETPATPDGTDEEIVI